VRVRWSLVLAGAFAEQGALRAKSNLMQVDYTDSSGPEHFGHLLKRGSRPGVSALTNEQCIAAARPHLTQDGWIIIPDGGLALDAHIQIVEKAPPCFKLNVRAGNLERNARDLNLWSGQSCLFDFGGG
jgi:hypothetical protein